MMSFSYTEYIQKLSVFLEPFGVLEGDLDIFAQAFLHRSGLNERKEFFSEHNERLEFLGDAVLELVVSNKLYHQYPKKPEGWLTDVRSSLVRGKHLGHIALGLGFGEYLLVSRGEELGGGKENPSLLADSMEAFIGALYLRFGLDQAQQFIEEYIYIHVDSILADRDHVDPKSALQEKTQAIDGSIPNYVLREEKGMDHEKEFVMDVFFQEKKIGTGIGSSKKKAQEKAAQHALDTMSEW